jgi:SH3 domain-containing YSC84-like protein 1
MFERIHQNMSYYRSINNVIKALLLVLMIRSQVQSQNLQVPASESPVSSESGVVIEAAVVLQELTNGNAERIPERLLAEASAIAIVPHYMQGAFVIGISGGRGVVVTRNSNGNWMAPEFITIGGGSVGWQIGVQSVDLVLVFRTPRSLANLRQGKVTLGANASVAAGPLGRYASAATDARMQAEILTYSRSRGLFAGVSLSGASLQPDNRATQNYYQMAQGSSGVVPASAQALVNEIVRYSAVPQQPPSQQQQPANDPALAATYSNVPPAFGNIPPGSTPLEQRVAEVSQAVLSLQSKVDTQWKQYLELPPAWFQGQPITSEEAHQVLIRYERVETNPQFFALRSQPEFQTILKALRDLTGQLSSGNARLILPSPPIVSKNGNVLPY